MNINDVIGDFPDDVGDPLRARPARSTRTRKTWTSLLLLAQAVAMLLVLLKKHPKRVQAAGPQAQTPNIRVAAVCRGGIGQYIEALGTVTPLTTVNLYSQVNRQVVGVHYLEEQIVKEGDPLIDLDPRPYEAQLEEYEGQLGRDEASLKQAKSISRVTKRRPKRTR